MVKRRTLTQAKVLATANQLIESKGINGLTIRDLALVLDVRPQSIYNYVDSLSDLLDQVGLQFVQNVADRLTEKITGIDGHPLRWSLLTLLINFFHHRLANESGQSPTA